PSVVDLHRPSVPARPAAPLTLPGRPGNVCPGGAASCPLDLPCGGGCGDNATCKGTGASEACVCNQGFASANGACVDVDECADTPCSGEPPLCVNPPGPFRCDCAQGYEGKAPFCTDVDECLDRTSCDANAYCRNEPGSFSCACRSGFLGDGRSCHPDH